MKTAGLIGVIAACALIACQTNEPTFTLVKKGRRVYAYGYKDDGTIGDHYCYSEIILIDNMPRIFVNKHKLKRLMIYHSLRLTSSIDSLQMSTDLDYAIVRFVRATPRTREYYIARSYGGIEIGYNGVVNSKTRVGAFTTIFCKKDDTKRYVKIDINKSSVTPLHEDLYYEDDTLQNDCAPAWYEANKDNDLVKYYMELRNK